MFMYCAKYTMGVSIECKMSKPYGFFCSMFMCFAKYHIIHIFKNSSENNVDIPFNFL